LKQDNYLIKYNDFKGPAILLLDLVKKKKIDIYQIELSTIIIEFQQFINKAKKIELDTVSGFIYIVSILLEIKSRSIIPSQDKNEHDEDVNINDRKILLLREKQFNTFQKISNYLKHLKEIEELYYIKETPLEAQFIEVFPDIFENLNLDDLNKIASRLLKKEELDIDLSKIYTDE